MQTVLSNNKGGIKMIQWIKKHKVEILIITLTLLGILEIFWFHKTFIFSGAP